ncbi:MAG: Acyl carrier protein phosphodiesterase [Candidatus Celerinatantimonas neptuna]|nr:MAG: Acyl carrier protein phosphodiesterase [Candidatus Celerinatantimonas neptuna]
MAGFFIKKLLNMNYLGHFYVASITNSSYCGALLGDFIKGNQWQHLPHSLQLGILLHRRLDSWIDQWVINEQITSLFPNQIRRFAPIALDLYWDYQLASYWSHWHPQPLPDLTRKIYSQLHHPDLPLSAQRVIESMIHHDWLAQYNQPDFIFNALQYIQKRMRSTIPVMTLVDTLWNQNQLLHSKTEQLVHNLKQLPFIWRHKILTEQFSIKYRPHC